MNIAPCDAAGKSLGDEYFVEESVELLGKPYHYKVNTCSLHNMFLRAAPREALHLPLENFYQF